MRPPHDTPSQPDPPPAGGASPPTLRTSPPAADQATQVGHHLIVYDEEIAQYLAEVCEYDWDRLATAKPTATRGRVAHKGEVTPHGHKKVAFSAVFDD
jgi:hypothetical protein